MSNFLRARDETRAVGGGPLEAVCDANSTHSGGVAETLRRVVGAEEEGERQEVTRAETEELSIINC